MVHVVLVFLGWFIAYMFIDHVYWPLVQEVVPLTKWLVSLLRNLGELEDEMLRWCRVKSYWLMEQLLCITKQRASSHREDVCVEVSRTLQYSLSKSKSSHQSLQAKADKALNWHISHSSGFFESGDRAKKKKAVINDAINADTLVSVTVNGQRRPSTQHLQQECMLTDLCQQLEWREKRGINGIMF